ncbi:MAG: hypothetical protein JSS16_03275 [Proteobacteria bacterium]|nr:hypothetical protein [Pseudomonadota bacterium]
MKISFTRFVAALAAGGFLILAAAVDTAAAAVPAELQGTIRLWASPQDTALVEKWEAGFRKQYPHVEFKNTWHGPESTLAGVYTDVADVALMAREIRRPVEVMAFQWVFQYAPFAVSVANAGFSAERASAQLAFFVHADNPLSRITFAQLGHVLGAASDPARIWGDLDVDGAWKTQPLHVIGPPVDSTDALYLRDTVLKGNRKWNPAYDERADTAQILAAFAKDANAISYLPVNAVPANAKVLAVGNTDDFAKPDAETTRSGRYPLTRTIDIVINRPPNAAIRSPLRDFLEFVLSAQGQALIAPSDGLVALNDVAAQRQRERLQ